MLTPAQARTLRRLSDDWTDAPDEGLDKIFMGLVDAGLADMRQAPGWQRRRTSAGRAAIGLASWKARPAAASEAA